ncbi:helix-turn-helix transcriptional regulator [Clostridium tyrobutyricum]|uniref:helix-turn-helix domain-containing protein n=1 Tax=Clostridium tyrobutyricum TaxID=1519 RepID=UPI001C389834|nr:helix-turn-helix transcriptional regulator [Clostridium tyrobutyricum]MBV4418286.1 helix-turn-helix transcriptional regulator [Clostridium tyrobutyricum]
MIRMKLHIKLAEKRLTQKQLSELTGIRLPTISAYCTDKFKTIPREHLNILCRFFNCKIEDLIEYIPDPTDGL